MPTQTAEKAISAAVNALNRALESWSETAPLLIDPGPDSHGVHPFLLAVTTAYDRHYPLVLSPDMIWLVLLEGFANHVNANADALREKFGAREGKLVINVKRDGFRKGDRANDWPGVFGELSSSVRAHIGASAHDLIVGEFSTTGAVEKAAMEVALLDTLQSFFIYSVSTLCGFPSITLEGTPEDWDQLRARAERLQAYDLDWWIPHVLPVLDEFVRASRNQPSKKFWCNFYKLSSLRSGDSHIQGHIVNLFPYFGARRADPVRLVADFEAFQRTWGSLKSEAEIEQDVAKFKASLAQGKYELASKGTLRRNPYLGRTAIAAGTGMETGDVTTKVSCAPLLWEYFGATYQMELLAGFVGASQDKVAMAIRPEIGWAVRQTVGR